MELIFEVREAEEGGYVARALGQAIFTEAETWQELRDNVLEATSLHFEDAAETPKLIQLHHPPIRPALPCGLYFVGQY